MATVVCSNWKTNSHFHLKTMTTTLMPSPIHRAKSPDISVTSAYDEAPGTSQIQSSDQSNHSTLAPPNNHNRHDPSDGSDRYFTASSGDDCYDDEDDDGMFIRLDTDSDNGSHSLSGFHIDIKTLKEVSSMLARYNPIIQSDVYGNPTFVAPPPPPEENYLLEESMESPSKDRLASTASRDSTITGDEDFDSALQELDQALIDQDRTLFSDAMTELTDVMEKMTNFMGDTAAGQS